MNQVTEMLRLAPGASVSDAIARLSTLFDMMGAQKGFRSAEVLRRTDEPDLLLVLHAWDSIQDWQAFRSSDAKVSFSAGRPASLYSFVPCGMDWRLESGDAEGEGSCLRMEVLKGPAEPVTGRGIRASATFTYQDYEPAYEGATLRLTRLDSAPAVRELKGDAVIADEVYESLYRYAAAPAGARLAQ